MRQSATVLCLDFRKRTEVGRLVQDFKLATALGLHFTETTVENIAGKDVAPASTG